MRSRKFLCAVLVLVMAVSLCVPAFAATGVAVNSVKIDNKPASGQLDVAAGDSTQLTATVSYTFNDLPMTSTAVTWSSANTGVATIDELGNITAVGVGTTVMTATAVADTAKSDTITIRIVPTVTVSPASLGVCVGGTKTLTASAAPAGTYTYTWSSSDAAIAAVSGNGAAAVVTGVSEGAADITVTAAANGVESAPAACAVTVYPDAAGIAIHDASGADITGLTTTPGQLTCVTTPAEAVNGGTVAWKSSDPAVATVDETGKVTAVGTGTANITCTFTGGTVKTAACSVEVKYSEAKQADAVYVSAVYGKETSMNGAYSDISSKFAALCGSAPASDAKISFYNFTNTCGTLHGSSGTVTDGSSCAFSELKTMIFTPTGIGTETVYYTLSSYPDQMTGSIVVTVTSTSSLVTVNLDNTDPYTFSAATVKDNASAAGQIRDAVYAASGGDYSYIVFGAENTAAGTLYSRENGGRVGTSDKFYYGASGTNLTSQLYFVPETSGTYSREFAAFDASGQIVANCVLKIVVPDDLSSSKDVYYTTPMSSQLTMNEADFISWFRGRTAQSNYLSDVEFTVATYSNAVYKGYFQYGTQTVAVGDGTKFCTGTYSGATSASKYLSKLQYNSPAAECYIVVDFTCRGGAAKNSVNVTQSGKMYISVTENTVGDITYQVSYGVDRPLEASDFVKAYCEAMGVTAADSFNVKFASVPAKGTLFVASSGSSTAINSGTRASYTFRVNYNGAGAGIGDVTYVPGDYSSGSDDIEYAAYTQAGKLLYVGKLGFVYSSSGGGMACYSEGRSFSTDDFYNSADADPVLSVSFTQPGTGALYLNYANGSGTAVTGSMKLYTKYPADGEYAVSAVTYIPPEGYSGAVTVTYTATTAKGRTTRNTLTITVSSKSDSAVFGDVTAANTGTWSANSVDYAYKWGLVSGTGAARFSPTGVMQRGMLAEILYRAAGSPLVYGSSPFTDVKYTDYYYRAVTWAYNSGIVGGTGAGKFSPKNPVTREQLAVILYNYARAAGKSTSASAPLSGYSDAASVDGYAYGGMSWCVGAGIIGGTSGNRLNPRGTANRAQVTVMLHRFLTK
jgi:uncharacterized protein YjdB